MAKKHYRAFKKQVEIKNPKGIVIPNNQKSKLIAFSCIIAGLIFIKGIILGYLISNRD